MQILYKEIDEKLTRRRDLWASKRDPWLKKSTAEEEIYYNDKEGTGTNFTWAQLAKIDQGSGVPVTINYAYPITAQKLAILSQTKPAFKVVGLDDRGKKYSEVLDKAAKSVMYQSEAVGEEEQTIKNMLVLGMGISAIEETDYYQFGEFDISYVDLHPSLVILDSNSRRRSNKEMQGYFIEKEVPIEEAKQRYQSIIDEINERGLAGKFVKIEDFTTPMTATPVGQGTIDSDGFDEKIVVQEYYDKKFTTMYFMEDPETGNIKRMFAENLPEGMEGGLSGAAGKEENMFVRKTINLGNYTVAIEMKPIRDYPIKVKYFEWGGRPYRSYSMIHFIKLMQDTLDKAIQTMLVNGMLTNNAGYVSPKGGITPEDRPKWESGGSKPGNVKEYNLVKDASGAIIKPEREQIQQLSNFFPAIVELMKSGMEYSTGINAVVQGNAQEANVDVFSSLQQYQDSAMQRIKMAMNHVNLANQQLGNVVIDYIIANTNTEQKYAFFDNEGKYAEIDIIKEHAKDFKMGRYQVLSIASEAMPTQKMAMSTELFKISQTTPDPVEKNIYIKKAFELVDMRGYDEMQDDLDSVKQLNQTIAQKDEQIERNEELMKQYENRALNAEYKAKKAEMLSNIETNLSVAEAETVKDLKIEKLEAQLKEKEKPKSA